MQLKLCGENITENNIIKNTISNFHASDLLHQQYQDGRFRTYSDLISCIVAEKSNELLLKNRQPPYDLVALPKEIAMSSNKRGCGRFQGQKRGKKIKLSDGSKFTRTNLKKITMRHQERKINGNYLSAGHKFSRTNFKKFKWHHEKQWEINGDILDKEKTSSHKCRQSCFRCGMKGHLSRNCRTSRHLVDLYRASIREM